MRTASRTAAGRGRTRGTRPGFIRRLIAWILIAGLVAYGVLVIGLVSLRWIPPVTTAVQIQRRLEALVSGTRYEKRYQFVPLRRIAPDLQHAAVASEDSRFYEHHGFDWVEIQKAMDDDDEDRPMRGASTITQQLVKNLFLTTHRSFLRKGIEASLVPIAEFALGKQRILELYLNVVEWGPGVFGAQAASQYHYKTSAAALTRDQAARLAAILPNPIRRRPARVDRKAGVILTRMRQMGW